MKKLITYLPINIGAWIVATSEEWENLRFVESVLDWSLLPENAYGKLYVEIYDDTRDSPDIHTISVRLMYQQEPAIFIGVESSEITYTGSKRWQLLESEWFKLPRVSGVSCLWIQGKTTKGGRCAVALANLAIAEEVE